MLFATAWNCVLVFIALSKHQVAGWSISPQALQDDISDFDWDEDVFYEEEPVTKRVIGSLDDGRPTSLEGVLLVQRQDLGDGPTTSNPNSAAGITPSEQQDTNVTQAPNTTNTTSTDTGVSPGLIGNAPNPNANQVNCSDLVTGRANDCWAQLRLTDYVNDWIENHNCYEGEGFSTCFLRQNGFPGLDCSQISVSACPAIQSDAVAGDPKRFYVAYNIYAINAFFYSWWLAVGTSGSIASDNIGKIVQILDPPSDMNFIAQTVLVAFQSIFAIVPGVAGVWASHSALNYRFQIGAQIISNVLATVPNVGRFLFPTDTSGSQIVQLAELANNFGVILQQVQSNLNQTLVSVMSNVTEFLAFAEQGNFSSKPQSLPDQASYLYYAFNTYLISQAMNGNNLFAVIGKGTDPLQLKTNGTELAHGFDIKCDAYDEQNICDAWWYSGNYRSAFTLDNFSKMNKNYGEELSYLFQNLTSGELLFEGAYACSSQGNFGGSVNITVSKVGVNTACISQLRVLTWDMSCHAEDDSQDSKNCEFLEMEAQPTFWYKTEKWRFSPQRVYSVPYGYLGPAVTQKDTYLIRD